ncbi:MAG: hypothetical protein ABL933_08755 [Methyloglobulus sp.]
MIKIADCPCRFPELLTNIAKPASNTNPNKFSLKPSPEGESQDEGIHIATYWDWYNFILTKPMIDLENNSYGL